MPTSNIIKFENQIDVDNIDSITMHTMIFIQNALIDGWSIKKKQSSYVFTKKHEGRREILRDDFLPNFIKGSFSQKL